MDASVVYHTQPHMLCESKHQREALCKTNRPSGSQAWHSRDINAPGFPYFSGEDKTCETDSSGEVLVVPVMSMPTTWAGDLTYAGVSFCLLDTAAAMPPPSRAPAVKTAACTIAELGILCIIEIRKCNFKQQLFQLTWSYKISGWIGPVQIGEYSISSSFLVFTIFQNNVRGGLHSVDSSLLVQDSHTVLWGMKGLERRRLLYNTYLQEWKRSRSQRTIIKTTSLL
jgi:hypothetical protein